MKKASILLLFMIYQASAQDIKKVATDHFNNQNWEAALSNYQTLAEQGKADSSDWYNMAFSQMQLQLFDEALSNFDEAKRRNITASFADFNISKIYALREDKKNMYMALEEGASNGLFAYTQLNADSAFLQFRTEERFKTVLDKVKLNAFPCLSNDDMRHFDFWLGEWDVYFQGSKVGENSITMAEGGCAVHENYTTSRNYSGQSINYFDPIDKKWHQHWVGTGGDVYNYLETDRGKGMLQFESKFYNPANGVISLSRLTFTLNPDGTVKQLFENSFDEGKTWSQGFLGIYKRKE